jgi:hypothetical protein
LQAGDACSEAWIWPSCVLKTVRAQDTQKKPWPGGWLGSAFSSIAPPAWMWKMRMPLNLG